MFEEIGELRRRGIEVVPCSARRADTTEHELKSFASETLHLQPLRLGRLIHAVWVCMCRFTSLADVLWRVVSQGSERPARRLRALLHTLLGACYALRLKKWRVQHIHVHHGYFASWVAMVAARLLRIPFSMTLHGSDLLLDGSYLDTKLKNCEFCVTVSEFNRRFVLEHYPDIESAKIMVRRIGVHSPSSTGSLSGTGGALKPLMMLAVGRLHPVKDHGFLLRGCHELRNRGVDFVCLLAGEGTERPWIEHLIKNLGLETRVKLLGHLCRHQLDDYYAMCDLVVLTSRSEGIPVVLMEAMAHAKTVLAPAITGIPELVEHGKTGFLYRARSLDDFVAKIETIRHSPWALPPLRLAARRHVLEHFDREKNLAAVADLLISRITTNAHHNSHENPVLQ